MDQKTLQTKISKEFKRSLLFRGTFIAVNGAILILVSACYLPKELLQLLGIPLFLIGLFLIRLGLFPYKKLSKNELFPDKILMDDERIYYYSKQKALFSFRRVEIEKATFLKKQNIYGIAITLKDPKIFLLDPNFQLEKFKRFSQLKYKADLFFPFFSKEDLGHLLKEKTKNKDLLVKDHAYE